MLHSFFQRHTHSSEKPFLCTVCGKTFARQHIRDVHERAHFGEKRVSACYIISLNERSELFGIFLQYPCSFCDKRFTTNQKKDIHERIHTGVKPYECRECGKRFVQQHQLQVRPVNGRASRAFTYSSSFHFRLTIGSIVERDRIGASIATSSSDTCRQGRNTIAPVKLKYRRRRPPPLSSVLTRAS